MNADKRRFLRIFLLSLFVLNLSFAVQSQKVKLETEKEESSVYKTAAVEAVLQTNKLESNLMARAMPYNVFLPPDYASEENKGKRYPVIYLLHGLTGHFDNWAVKTKLNQYVANSGVILIMPEGDNGWYTDSSTVPKDKYESYIIQELIPEIDKKFRTIVDRKHRAIAGLSMGGYGSIKFGLKYPELFSLVGSFSGALGAASWAESEFGANNFIAKSLVSVYGKADSETRKANDIFQMVRKMPAEKLKTLPFIYQDCGTEDFLIKNNQDFADLLFEKKISHEFRQLPGKHDWKFWDAQVQEFLELSEKYLK